MERLSGGALGILAAIGGFVDMGAIVTAAQAGAKYRFALLWTLIPGVVGLILYADMAGRVAVASGRTMFDAIRERLGFRAGLIALVTSLLVNLITLVVEIGGMALVLKEVTRLPYLLWVPVVLVLLLVVLWKASFQLIENGSAAIGLAMLVAVVAMVAIHPPWSDVGRQLIHPRMETVDSLSKYLFVGISLFGGYMTPFQFVFYSAGAVEEEWDGKDLLVNRITTFLGSGFGGVISLGLIVTSGLVLFPQQADVSGLQEIGEPVQRALGSAGWAFLLLGIFGVCLGAALEASLSGAYAACQFFGWDWGKRARPREAPLFTLGYALMILVAVAIALTGVDPIKITVVVMAFAAASLPFTFLPVLLVANDEEYMGEQKNTWPVNAAAIVILVLLFAVSVLTLPLLIITGGGV